MSDLFASALILLAAIGCGLVAGIFFAFSTFLMTALGRLPPEQGISAMQAINVAVLNAWFFAVFFGTAAVCAILAVFAVMGWSGPGAVYLAAGSVLYLAGCILVTILFNVPLNTELAAVEPQSAEGARIWSRYLSSWLVWNHVRTIASLAAMASFLFAIR
jgi:uncharacterized membrane protein